MMMMFKSCFLQNNIIMFGIHNAIIYYEVLKKKYFKYFILSMSFIFKYFVKILVKEN